jgi:hypothetical protein
MVEIPVIPADFGPWCEAEGIHTVVAGAGDVHGIWRGKRLPPAEFLARLAIAGYGSRPATRRPDPGSSS